MAATSPGQKLTNRRKIRCMEWCLAEAIRVQHRDFVSTASTMSMRSDARQGRLLARFSAICPKTFAIRQGILGLERDYGTGNEARRRAMQVVYERFATWGACMPHTGKSPPPRDAAAIIANPDGNLKVHDTGAAGELKEELLHHIKTITHMVVADGAGDGHIALEDLKKGGVPP